MRRAIIHIGMPRTGSTSLQVALHQRRGALAEAGLLYPALAPPGSPEGADVNHQGLGEALDGRRPRSEARAVLERLDRTVADTDADTVLLSYEDFALQKARFGVPGILREAFARRGYRMEAVVVVKPQPEQLNSAYAHRAQLIQEAGTFRDFVRAHGRSGRFDYHARMQPWLAATEGRLTAIPLRDARSEAPVIERFLRALDLDTRLGPDLAGLDTRIATNRSAGPLAVEASRRLRRMRVHRQVRIHPREIGHVLDAAAWSRGLDPEPLRGDAPDAIGDLEARWAASNARFAREAWGQPWDAVVARAPTRPPNELATRPIAPDEAAAITTLMAETVRHFGFRTPPAWRRIPADIAESQALRLARLVGYTRWRVP